MANPEHLEKLEDGVEAWNIWRKENPEIIPDLEWAELKGYSLTGGINFSQANLSWAKFNAANLSGADFKEANLEHTSFNEAYLSETNFEKADLSRSEFREADLRGANLSQACLDHANLSKAHLQEADLSNAKLYNADLSEADLRGADLSDAQLHKTCFKAANLNTANFSKAKLLKANLSESQSLSTIFSEAILTQANITNLCINEETDFKNVKCDYIYIYKNDHVFEWMLEQQRHPQNGEIFEPGGFEEFVRTLYKVPAQNSEKPAPVNQRQRKQNIKKQKIIDLNFNEGIDWQAFLNSYEELGGEVGEDSIPIQNIKYKRDGTVIIYIQSPPGYDQDSVIKFIQEQYQQQFKHIEKISNQERRDKEREIEEYKKHNIDLLEIIKKQTQQPTHVNQEHNLNINNYDNSTNDSQNIWGDGNQVVKGNRNNFVDGNDNIIGSHVTSNSGLQQNSISEIIFSLVKSRLVGWLLYTILVLSVMAFIIWLPIAISHQSTPQPAETEVQGRNNP